MGSTPAERCLWREGVYDEIEDAVARQLEHRANVSVGAGEPSGILSLPAGPNAGRRVHDRTIRHSGDCLRTSPPLRVSTRTGRTTATRDDGESQAGGANNANRQLIRDSEP